MTAPFARYKNAVAICNRSGWKMYRADMVEDGYLKGLLVHPEWYDPPQPQEEPFDPEEGIAIYKPAPDLIPSPPAPVVSIAGNVLTWTQADPPVSTIMYWTVWRQLTAPGSLFLLLAKVTPIVPIDYFIQGPDRIKGDPTNSNLQGLTYTDAGGAAGMKYYVVTTTADGGTEGLPGLNSPNSNTVTHA